MAFTQTCGICGVAFTHPTEKQAKSALNMHTGRIHKKTISTYAWNKKKPDPDSAVEAAREAKRIYAREYRAKQTALAEGLTPQRIKKREANQRYAEAHKEQKRAYAREYYHKKKGIQNGTPAPVESQVAYCPKCGFPLAALMQAARIAVKLNH